MTLTGTDLHVIIAKHVLRAQFGGNDSLQSRLGLVTFSKLDQCFIIEKEKLYRKYHGITYKVVMASFVISDVIMTSQIAEVSDAIVASHDMFA